MVTQNFINECKNRANCNRLGRFYIGTPPAPVPSKNLLDESLGFQNGYISASNVFTPDNKTALYNQYIEVEGGETYTFSTNATVDNMVISMYNSSDTFLGRQKLSNVSKLTQTMASNVAYVRYAINYNNSSTMTQTILDSLQVMVEVGNDRTEPYEPYGYITPDVGDETIEINQSNNLVSMELKDTCYVNNSIIGSVYVRSADIKLLNLPQDTELVGQEITPEVGVKYANQSTEYEAFDKFTIESVKDEQTASNTEFTAMNGGTDLDKQYTCMLSFDEGTTHTIYEFYQDACRQLGLTPTDATIDNGDIVMTGNPFQNKETLRNVLEEVARVSCSLIDFNWAERTITLKWLSDQIDYEFNTSDYSILEGSLTQYGPLNEIIIGNSQLDGENVVMRDDESIEEYGLHSIMIDAPYFLYTEELRTEAIQAIYDKLDGLTYYDLKLTTPYGKPFLKIGDKIRINTNENQVFDTYVLSHTFTYDGAFRSVIESPALTSEEQKIKNEKAGTSIKERLTRTEVIVDKTTGDISALTDKVSEVEDEFGNYYTIEQTNSLIQNAETGVTNTFSEAGGNNIFRNTGLWFENSDYETQAQNPYEFWSGVVERTSEDRAANRNALLLKNTTLSQTETVPNGNYTVSFKYKKLLPLSEAKIIINDVEFELDGNDEQEFQTIVEVNSQVIKIDFVSNTDDACEIYDLMVNAGKVKLAYSQNQNETTTDTVNISKGITITSSTNENIIFKADYDGTRIYDKTDMENPITKFTDKGIKTKEIEAEDHNKISGVLIQKIGNQTWFTKI